MSKASFRNAPVAALIYEFLYDAYALIESERARFDTWWDDEIMFPLGVFDHGFISKWEWSAEILENSGVMIHVDEPGSDIARKDDQRPPMRQPCFKPLMTLEECLATDFSAFETFDNYCFAMFTFNQHDFTFGSPRFLEAVAAKDDIFEIDKFSRWFYDEDRFREKVMTRWDEMLIREFKAAF
ncbi:hypothetical protein HPDFL43_08289 [Hoeflea phototrophica DFL-43]|jgi:hypothetical protein|uniref:Uncharacterized protein n=1 Tax=Hoeflea phototrophica (strain DSM 17068 / NCIMB 14078 / DFL-43) TaxID=411684 RepID=A9D9F9_HOEPD|nr:hypothetical protein [Hoeflea phototrophica]EDQ32933.1 hypothetical protein HPDFL43_08289 [Hoeflea phototrophica DFL-43]